MAPRPAKRQKTSPQKQQTTPNKRLSSFFSKATEEERWHRQSPTPQIEPEPEPENDTIVDDDISDDALPQRKPNGRAVGQRFVKPSQTQKSKSPVPESDGSDAQHRPWADRYGPANLDELAVHKKKVQDVHKWLEDVLAGKNKQRLLLLKGPAGSGKTTTVSLLSAALKYVPIPWQNPMAYEAATTGSVAAQFDDFLNRGCQFGSLSFSSGIANSENLHRPILLVEDFPSTMTRSSGIDSFRNIISRFLARSTTGPAAPFQSHSTGEPPLIMIVSETLLSSSTAFSDSFTAHRLLGPEILNHPLATVIEFNPVAPTIIAKALDTVIKKEARDSGRRRTPGPAVLQHLAEMGDVRNAINTLEFLCIRSTDADWSGTVAAKSKKGKGGTTMTDMEKDSLKLVSQRETTLDMFHAAGKIVYNKRDDPKSLDSSAELPPKPPDHLMYLYSPKISQVDIEALLNETGTDIQTFISTLHENYALSCNGETFIDSFEACSDIFSISDILNPDARRHIRSRANASSSQANMSPSSTDALRQDEISFNVATRGLLFNLPYPVNRAAASNTRPADRYKIFYPASLRLWKATDEIDCLISMFASPTDVSFVTGRREGVASWKNSSFGARQSSPEPQLDNLELRKLTPTRDELTLEILPYLYRVKLVRKQDVKVLDKITQFHGTSVAIATDEPEDEEPKEETIVAAEKVSAVSKLMAGFDKAGTPRKASATSLGVKPFGKHLKEQSMSEAEMDKLFLEDDDIVDD